MPPSDFPAAGELTKGNEQHKRAPGMLRVQLIYLLSPFFCTYSTKLKRFTWKLATLGKRVEFVLRG